MACSCQAPEPTLVLEASLQLVMQPNIADVCFLIQYLQALRWQTAAATTAAAESADDLHLHSRAAVIKAATLPQHKLGTSI